MAAPKRIGQILKERGLLTEQEINLSIEQQKITGDLLGETFIKLGFVSAPEMAKALSEQAGMPYLNLHEYTISEDALKLVPKDVAERVDRKSTRLNSSHTDISRMPSSA